MKKIFAGLLLCLLPLFAYAEMTVPVLTGRLNDLAGTIPPHLRSQVESRLADFEKTTSNQVVILTIPTLENDEIASFSQRVFESWKLGQKSKDNGILVVVIKDRVDNGQGKSIRIHTGRGLEGALPDITCTHIVVDFMKPLMKEGKYFEGFSVGIDKIIAATKGEYHPESSDAPTDKATSGDGFTGLIVIVCLVLFVFSAIFSKILGGCISAFTFYYLLPSSLDGGAVLTVVTIGFVIGLIVAWIIQLIARSIGSSGYYGGGSSSDSSGGGFFGSSSSDSGGFSGGGGDSGGGGGGD